MGYDYETWQQVHLLEERGKPYQLLSKRCICEFVYVTTVNPAFCLALYLTGVNFRDELQHVGHVDEQKIKYWPIRTREIVGVRL